MIYAVCLCHCGHNHLGCDLAAGWKTESLAGRCCLPQDSLAGSESAVCLARKSESAAATGSLLFGLGAAGGDHNHDMSDSFKLTPAKSVDSEADPLTRDSNDLGWRLG